MEDCNLLEDFQERVCSLGLCFCMRALNFICSPPQAAQLAVLLLHFGSRVVCVLPSASSKHHFSKVMLHTHQTSTEGLGITGQHHGTGTNLQYHVRHLCSSGVLAIPTQGFLISYIPS